VAGTNEIGNAKRILIAGTSGSGKTTLAAKISATLRVPHTEIDALHHGPGWTKRQEFESEVAEFAAQECWITEWQYHSVRDLLASRAEVLIFLDYSRPLVMSRVVKRTVRRVTTHEVLWNGNVEPPLHTIVTNRENIIRWAWTTHAKNKDRVNELSRTHPRLRVIRLSSPRQTEAWLTTIQRAK
jgi:adenylate kinase family enzyme